MPTPPTGRPPRDRQRGPAWDEDEETPPPERARRPRPWPPALPARDVDDEEDEEDEEDETVKPPVPQPITRRRLPDGPNPLDDPRAPSVLRRDRQDEPPRPPRPSPPPSERWDQQREYDRGMDAGSGRRPPRSAPDEESAELPYPDDSQAYQQQYGPPGYEDRYQHDRYDDDRYGGDYRGGPPRGARRNPRSQRYEDDDWDRRGQRRGRPRGSAEPYGGSPYGDGPHGEGPYGARERRRSPQRDRPRHREPWQEWRDTAAQWLSASLPVPGAKGRRFPLIFLLIALVLVGLAGASLLLGPKLLNRVGGGSGNSSVPPGPYTPGPTPTTQAGFKKFVSAGSNYSLDYPQGWTATNQAQTVQGQPDDVEIFSTPTQGAPDSLVVEQPGADANVADTDIISSEVQAAQQGGVTFTPTSTIPIQVNIGGEYWLRLDYTVSGGGQQTHEAIFAGHHEGRAYVIALVSGADTFEGDYATYFRPALNSFRFNA
jgi:hypothetical protein